MEFEVLQKVLTEVLGVYSGEVTMEATITKDLGADSLDAYQIVLRLEEELNVELDAGDIEKIETVKDAVDLLVERRK